MNINKLARNIHAANVAKGFWKKRRSEGEKLFLIITELAEMCESHRKGKVADWGAYKKKMKRAKLLLDSKNLIREKKIKYKDFILEHKKECFEWHIKDTVQDELADAFIRMCDYCVGFKIRIDETRIREYAKEFGREKMNNLGEELLKISGHIRFIHRGIVKELTAAIVFAKLLKLSNQMGVDLKKHIEYKMRYNATRPKMHNKKY